MAYTLSTYIAHTSVDVKFSGLFISNCFLQLSGSGQGLGSPFDDNKVVLANGLSVIRAGSIVTELNPLVAKFHGSDVVKFQLPGSDSLEYAHSLYSSVNHTISASV